MITYPHTLLLGRLDDTGRPRNVGRTHPLAPGQRRQLAGHLNRAVPRRAGGIEHPWPLPLPATWSGRFGQAAPLPYIQVEPTTVVEVQVNTAFEHGRWRHPPAFVRHRPDLSVYDVPSHTATETPGNRGAWLLRRDEGERTEFIALSLWDSEDAIRAFAGDDIEAAVLCPEGERYLIGGESAVIHYDVVGEAIPELSRDDCEPPLRLRTLRCQPLPTDGAARSAEVWVTVDAVRRGGMPVSALAQQGCDAFRRHRPGQVPALSGIAAQEA